VVAHEEVMTTRLTEVLTSRIIYLAISLRGQYKNNSPIVEGTPEHVESAINSWDNQRCRKGYCVNCEAENR